MAEKDYVTVDRSISPRLIEIAVDDGGTVGGWLAEAVVRLGGSDLIQSGSGDKTVVCIQGNGKVNR